MSARRSARSHSTQIPPPPVHQNSSNSISANSNGKGERSTRSNNRPTPPPQVPPSQRSVSTDLTTTTTRSDNVAPRRSRRGNGDEKDKTVKQQEDEEEPGVNEDEVTRCICGQADYPGPSPRLKELNTGPDAIPDDVGNFFVQCDQCSVWQHGGCMGFSDEDMLPEQYYCEQCKPEFHKVSGGLDGLKHSRFLPVAETSSSRSSSLSSNVDPTKKREARSSNSESTKKRATLNSRGAYDEDEMLRRAIEESREMGTLGKRTREEGDEVKQNLKRQRTTSQTPSAESRQSQSPPPATDDPTAPSSMKMKNLPKLRGAAARNNREKEMRDKQKEQAAAQRAEAASKRAARTERRRGEESPPPPPTPTLSPSKAVQQMTVIPRIKADTPPLTKATFNRKNGRPTARRGRLGRNQYTRDQPLNGDNSDASMRDGSQDPHGINGSPQRMNAINGESGRSSKAKTHPARTSINEMKRRVAAILEFVGRMQNERRTQSSQHSSGSASSNGGANTPNGSSAIAIKTNGNSISSHKHRNHSPAPSNLLRAVEAGLKEASGMISSVSVSTTTTSNPSITSGGIENKSPTELAAMLKLRDEKDFEGLDSGQMMDIMAGELVQWQSVYGAYTR